MRFALTCLLTLTVAAGCGGLEDDALEIAEVEGLEGAADYAGGNYVKVKGTLAVGRSKRGQLGERERYHGYTMTARRGDVIRVRGVPGVGMGLTAIYAPKTARGAWGKLLLKRWSYESLGRPVPTVEHEVTEAGTYLVVFGVPAVPGAAYAITSCRGECEAAACAEVTYHDKSGYNFVNFVSRAEADLFAGPAPTGAVVVARDGSCGSQSVVCSRPAAPVCGTIVRRPRVEATYSNVCQAQRALRAARGDDLGSLHMTVTPGACAN